MDKRLIESQPHTLIVNEIFYSIQGESTHAGRPCVFVRLSRCNLRCTYCDTEYAFDEGKEMSIDEIMSAVRRYKCNLVEVTGGEPLLQMNVHELLSCLCDENYEVLLETSGSMNISKVEPRVKRIVDFKCPSSKMMNKNLWENVSHLKTGDEVKFVLGNREDYQWSKEMMEKYQIGKRCSVLMSAVFGELEPKCLVEWILDDNLKVRIQLQVHKYIWQPVSRRV
jgi:7-carboxy-7-deazaguanine synthase